MFEQPIFQDNTLTDFLKTTGWIVRVYWEEQDFIRLLWTIKVLRVLISLNQTKIRTCMYLWYVYVSKMDGCDPCKRVVGLKGSQMQQHTLQPPGAALRAFWALDSNSKNRRIFTNWKELILNFQSPVTGEGSGGQLSHLFMLYGVSKAHHRGD